MSRPCIPPPAPSLQTSIVTIEHLRIATAPQSLEQVVVVMREKQDTIETVRPRKR